jgi:hypothetical protein
MQITPEEFTALLTVLSMIVWFAWFMLVWFMFQKWRQKRED